MPWKPLQFLINVNGTKKKVGMTETRTPDLLPENPVVLTLLLSFIFKKVGNFGLKKKQDGRLAPAYFSPNYKYFDQLLQTVKNKNYCFEFSFQRFFTNINSTTDFCVICLYAKVSRVSVENFLFDSAEIFRRGTLLCFRKFWVLKKFMPQRVMSRFPVEFLLSRSTETS